MQSYHNFCEACGEFAEFRIQRYNNYEAWNYWNHHINGIKKVHTFKGIIVNEAEETEEERNIRIQFNDKITEKINKIKKASKADLSQKYTCQIWLNHIDFKSNLQCSWWKKFYWFNCLFDWLKRNNNKLWPYWRSKINQTSISVNKEIENELDTILYVIDEKENIEWKLHMRNCDVFWQTWRKETWGICMIKKMHEGHTLWPIEEQNELTLMEAEKLIKDNSLTNIKTAELKRLKNNRLLTKFIKDELIEKCKRKIESMDEELNNSIMDIYKESTHKVEIDIDEWIEEEKTLVKFTEKKDVKMLQDNIYAIDKIRKKKAEAFQTILDVKHLQKEPIIITSENPETYKVSIDCKIVKGLENNDYALSFNEDELILSNNKRIKINDSSFKMLINEDNIWKYFSKIDLKENPICILKNENKISEITADREEFNINDFVILNQNLQNEKIEIDLTLWRETEQVKNYINETKTKIKTQIQNLSNLL